MSRSTVDDVDLPDRSSDHHRDKPKRMKILSSEDELEQMDVSGEVVMITSASVSTSLPKQVVKRPTTITTSCTSTAIKSSSSPASPSSRDESTFQKVNKLHPYVPYSAQLTATREELWANLQKHLFTAIASQGQPLQEWIHACEQ